jgi:hypothetical protein
MAVISKKRAEEALAEWGELNRKKAKLEAKRDEELKPLTTAYQEECAPINAKFNPKLERLNEQLDEVAKSLVEFFESGIDRETNEVKVQLLEGEVGSDGLYPVGEVANSPKRTIPARVFFDKVAERTQDFFDCLTVGIAKAEAWLGQKKVDAMADLKSNFSVKLSMKKSKSDTKAKKAKEAAAAE